MFWESGSAVLQASGGSRQAPHLTDYNSSQAAQVHAERLRP